MHGHFWTIAPHLRAIFKDPSCSGRAWSQELPDHGGQTISLTGLLHEQAGSDTLLVLVHGLGGSATSGYMRRAARMAQDLGVATLRLNLRGADRSSPDFYHAGLVEDLVAVSDSTVAKRYSRVVWLGFSLGGHVVLRAAALGCLRAAAVSSICAPLDLELSCQFIDRRGAWAYRRYLLSGLRDMYSAVCSLRGSGEAESQMPISVAESQTIRSIREWDERVVAARYGFAGAADYYRQMSVAPLLGDISVATRIVVAQRDPMVSARSLQAPLKGASPEVSVRICERGGHVGFPQKTDPTLETLRFLLHS